MATIDDRPPPLRLAYSDELGQLKVVQTADGAQLGTAAVAATWGQPEKLRAIDCIAVSSRGGIGDTSTGVLAVARCSGGIELLSPLTGEQLGSIPPVPAPAAAGGSKQQQDAVRVRGLHLLWGGSGSGGDGSAAPPSVLSVTQGGLARLHAPVAAPSSVQQEQQQWEQRASWQVPPQVCCTAFDPASGRLAVGCEGAELRLFDAASGEPVFAFKGGKPNKVGLVDKPWNTAIAFLQPAAAAGGGDGTAAAVPGSRLLVGTGHHKVRLYDSEAGKRPQMELSWGESRITCLALEPDGQRCWVGNGLGQLEVLDLQARRFCGAIKGLAGSARALAVHPESPVLASVCLDRYLRLHSTHSRQLLAKVYCKTLPTGVGFCPTDATMLPPRQEQQQEGPKQRRRKKQAGSGTEGEEDGEEQAQAVEEQDQEQQRKRSKQRRQGGGSGKQQKKKSKQEAA